MVFGNLKKRCGSLLSARNLALTSDFGLCAISIALIALELSFLPQWVSSGVTMVDFYIYIAITGIIIILTVIEFFMIKKRSRKGIHRLFLALSGVCAIQFIVGLVHIGLLYSRYQKKLLQKCIQKSPPSGFWWSLGYESMDEVNKIYQTCAQNWIRFSLLRLVSCVVFGFLACLFLFFIHKYYYHLKRNAQSDLNKLVYSSWEGPVTSPIENLIDNAKHHHHHNTETEKGMFSTNESTTPSSTPPPPPFFYHSPTPTFSMTPEEREANESIAFEKHAQRQKLYEEIAKRRRLDNSNRPSTASNRSSRRYSQLYTNIHPFEEAPPTYDPATSSDLIHPPRQQEEEGLLYSDPSRWRSIVREEDKIRFEDRAIDNQRLKELRHHDDDFDQIRSRRSSKRHRKLSVSSQTSSQDQSYLQPISPQDRPYQQPISSQDQPYQQFQPFYPQDESISPLQTTSQYHQSQDHQYQESSKDETAPLNPFDTNT